MPFTAEQLQERRKTLGGSEIPVVAGYQTFKSPLQLWAEKRGLAPAFEGNEFTEWGNRLEPVIRDKYAEVIQLEVRASLTVVCSRHPWRSVTPDGLVFGPGATTPERGVEIKCRGDWRADEWGEPGTDQVPNDVAVQCHWAMDILGVKRWDVATLIGGNKFGLYHLFYDAELAIALTELGRRFWDHVENGTEPPVDGSEATADYLREKFKMYGEELRPATVEETEALAQLLAVREQIKGLETTESELKNFLMQAIGTDAGIMHDTIGKATWKRPNGAQVDWKGIAETLTARLTPEEVATIMNQFSKPFSRRFLPTAPSKKKGK